MSLTLRYAALVVGLFLTLPSASGQKPPAKSGAESSPEEVVDKEYQPLVSQLKSKDVKVRLKAATELGGKGEAAASAATAVCNAILDASPKVSEAALVALEKIRPDLYQPVSQMILDSNRTKQFEAIAALGRKAEKAAPAKNVLLNRLRVETAIMKPIDQDEFLQRKQRKDSAVVALLLALQSIAPDAPECLKVWKLLAGAGNADGVSRVNAMDALISWAGEDDSRRKEILPYVASGLNLETLAVQSINRLAAYETLSKAYLPTLKKLKLSPNEAVRAAATRAVDAIENK